MDRRKSTLPLLLLKQKRLQRLKFSLYMFCVSSNLPPPELIRSMSDTSYRLEYASSARAKCRGSSLSLFCLCSKMLIMLFLGAFEFQVPNHAMVNINLCSNSCNVS